MFVVLFMLVSVSAICQENPPAGDVHASLVQGKKRSLIAWSGKDHSFTMEAVGKKAKPSDLPDFVNIDGLIVQSSLLPVPEDINLRNLNPSREKDLLTKYMNFELDYYRKKLRQNYRNPELEPLNLKGRVYLLWYFDTPPDSKIKRQVYLSTLFYDQVLDLNIPIFKLDDFTRAKELLEKLGNSLKIYNKRLDLALLSRQLSK
jgi:hypothetical protein